MKGRRSRLRSGRSASSTKQQWQGLADGLVSAIPSEEELRFFKQHIWDTPRRVLNEPTWDPSTRSYKASGRRVAVGLTQKQRDKIDARAEEFPTVDDYRLGGFSRGALQLLQQHFSVDDSYLGLCHEMIDVLFRDSKMQLGSPYAKQRIAEQVNGIDKALRTRFGVPIEAHRPRSKEDLHREWSRLKYLGRPWKEIADEASHNNPEGVTEDDVRKSVMRYRKRREPVQWVLRYLIYQSRT
jgi:cell fate (sporulation/competence/biofilm development) regulator YmcA (YheA/YmcA/DUF963 family)